MKKEMVDQMTPQQACDYAIDKIVEQGVRSLLPAPRNINGTMVRICVYGNDKGHHCAIGWLLDETDHELMGSIASLMQLLIDSKDKVPTLMHDNYILFNNLQKFHDLDNSESRNRIKKRLSKQFGIDTDTNPNYQKWVDSATK